MTPRRPRPPWPVRARNGLGVAVRSLPFGLWFLGQMVAANWQVARDLLTPGLRTTPGVAAVPLRCRTRVEVTVLSNLITLTPGTVTLEVDRHGHVLYVLDIYAPDTADGLRRQVHGLESRMLRMLRGVEPPAPPEGDGYGWSGRTDGPRPLSGSRAAPTGPQRGRSPAALRRRARAALADRRDADGAGRAGTPDGGPAVERPHPEGRAGSPPPPDGPAVAAPASSRRPDDEGGAR
nr:Na+/H+ antiporter subunit E [uncultured Actinotalea sp.]